MSFKFDDIDLGPPLELFKTMAEMEGGWPELRAVVFNGERDDLPEEYLAAVREQAAEYPREGASESLVWVLDQLAGKTTKALGQDSGAAGGFLSTGVKPRKDKSSLRARLAARAEAIRLAKTFDPDQARDESGKWTSGGGGPGINRDNPLESNKDLAERAKTADKHAPLGDLATPAQVQKMQEVLKQFSATDGKAYITAMNKAWKDAALHDDTPEAKAFRSAKALDDRAVAKAERLQKEWQADVDQRTAAVTTYDENGVAHTDVANLVLPDDKEVLAAWDKALETGRVRSEAGSKLWDLRREACIKALEEKETIYGQEHPAKISWGYQTTTDNDVLAGKWKTAEDQDKEMSGRMKTAVDFTSRLLRGEGEDSHRMLGKTADMEVNFKPIPWNDPDQRACYTMASKSVHYSAKGEGEDVPTLVHEIGHGVEAYMGGTFAAKAFLQYRCGNDPVYKLADLSPGSGYKDYEYGRPDNFGKAFGTQDSFYVGKDYNYGATEVISMGLQKLYENPHGFARDDPEYFNFTLMVLKGHGWKV